MNGIDRLIEVIGYPRDDVSPRGNGVALTVDGGEVRVREEAGRLVMECPLRTGAGEAVPLVKLAGYAAGRMLKEEAVLAWDPAEGEPILWQDVAVGADDEQLRRVFELFASSCDWWRERLRGESVERGADIPMMMIRP